MATPDQTHAFDLARQEARIERGRRMALAALIETGDALSIIRDQRLYRRGWRTFEDYCQDRWEMRREQADTLIRTAVTAQAIEATGLPLPGSQRALLALAPVAGDPETLTDVWTRALQASPSPTSAQVAALVRPGPNAAFGPETTGPDYGGYAAEVADPEGWRDLAERLRAEDRRRKEAGEPNVVRMPPMPNSPPDWRRLADTFARIAVESAACAAAWAQIMLDHRDEPAVEQDDHGMVDAIWEVEDFTFEAWPVFTEFWVTAHTEGWLDVRGYVTDRIVNSGADTWAVQRAARIVAALSEGE